MMERGDQSKEGRGGTCPLTVAQSSPKMKHDGGGRLRCKEGVEALCLEVLG